MKTFDCIEARRSVRDFESTPVEDAALGKIVTAALCAPVGMRAYDSLCIRCVASKDALSEFLKMARKEMCVARQQLGGRHQAFIDHEQVRKHEKYDQNDRNGVFGDIIAGLFPLLAPFDFRNELRLSRGYNLFFHQSSPSPYWIHLPVLNMTRVSAAMMTNRIHAMAHASP